MTGAARIRVGDPPHGPPTAAPTPPEAEPVRRPERNPDYRGYCSLCGAVIYPSPHNFYCRSCAAAVSAKGFH